MRWREEMKTEKGRTGKGGGIGRVEDGRGRRDVYKEVRGRGKDEEEEDEKRDTEEK